MRVRCGVVSSHPRMGGWEIPPPHGRGGSTDRACRACGSLSVRCSSPPMRGEEALLPRRGQHPPAAAWVPVIISMVCVVFAVVSGAAQAGSSGEAGARVGNGRAGTAERERRLWAWPGALNMFRSSAIGGPGRSRYTCTAVGLCGAAVHPRVVCGHLFTFCTSMHFARSRETRRGLAFGAATAVASVVAVAGVVVCINGYLVLSSVFNSIEV